MFPGFLQMTTFQSGHTHQEMHGRSIEAAFTGDLQGKSEAFALHQFVA